jgi:thiamine-phosphate pyrophosphorylase
VNPSSKVLAAARLYAITPDRAAEEVERLVAAWLRGGVDVVQLRHKSMPRRELLGLAYRLGEQCRAADVPLIVDDHLDVALLSGAAGAHLGPEDLSVASARKVAPPSLILGASASDTAAAVMAERAGADYLGSGPAYSTPIKGEKRVIGPDGVAAISAAVAIPVFAIGGIDRDRVAELRAAGVDRVCIIRALSETADPEKEAAAIKALLA